MKKKIRNRSKQCKHYNKKRNEWNVKGTVTLSLQHFSLICVTYCFACSLFFFNSVCLNLLIFGEFVCTRVQRTTCASVCRCMRAHARGFSSNCAFLPISHFNTLSNKVLWVHVFVNMYAGVHVFARGSICVSISVFADAEQCRTLAYSLRRRGCHSG